MNLYAEFSSPCNHTGSVISISDEDVEYFRALAAWTVENTVQIFEDSSIPLDEFPELEQYFS